MSTESVKRELRVAMSEGNDKRANELRDWLNVAGESLPRDDRHAYVGEQRVERAIDAPGTHERNR